CVAAKGSPTSSRFAPFAPRRGSVTSVAAGRLRGTGGVPTDLLSAASGALPSPTMGAGGAEMTGGMALTAGTVDADPGGATGDCAPAADGTSLGTAAACVDSREPSQRVAPR